MKRLINKNTILGLVVGIIISGVTVYAVSTAAKDITFKAKNTNWKVGNVADALDSLYISKTSDNYSTDEKVVGTWVDGKPVYQKTVIFTTGTYNGYGISSFLGVSNIETVCYINVMLRPNENTNEWLNASSYQNHVAFSYEAKNDVIKMWSEDQEVGWWWSKPAICTIQYTKTTDKSNN